MDKDGVSGKGAIIYFGNIYLQKDGSVQVAIGLFLPVWAAAEQHMFSIRKIITWIITGDTGKHWIS